MRTKLTVIIPHYNWPERLEILLNTIPDRPEIQVIVIDDNSDRDVEKLELIVEENSGRNVLFLKNNPQNRSAGACRNIGLMHAQGEWVLFADADDYFLPGWYEKANKYFETGNEIVFFPPTSIRLDTNEISSRHKGYANLIFNYLDRRDQESELRLRCFYSSPCSKMIRLEFLKKYNIDFEEIFVSDDVMFSVKCGHYASLIECSREVIYVITQSANSLTRRKSKKSIDMGYRVMIRRGDFFYKNLSEEEIRQLHLQTYGLSILYETVKQGYIDLALKYFVLLCKSKIPVLNFEIVEILIKKIKPHLFKKIHK